jgi:sulfide dehydrogenase cytochrome subunit
MNQTRSIAPYLAAALVGAAAVPVAATAQPTEISRGAVIATTCYTCHGTHGDSPSSIPSIDYFQPSRMIEVLKGFRSGQRASTVMGRHATAYTDDEIAEVANYLGSLPKKGK